VYHEEAEMVWTSEEEMAFLKENQAWIKEEIKSAIAGLDLSGWRRAGRAIVSFGTPAAIASVIVALIAVAVMSLVQAFGHLKEETAFRTTTDSRLEKIEASLLVLRLSRAATPTDPRSQAEAAEIITEARSNRLLPIVAAEQAGRSFVDASLANPNSWNIALEFASYRSSLNANLLAVPNAQQIATTAIDPKLHTHYFFNVVDGERLPKATVGGTVPHEAAATVHKLGQPDPDEGQTNGSQVILLEGGAIALDNMFMRHVVVRNSRVISTGEAIHLDDVTFVNCVFVLTNVPRTRSLALAILSQAAVIFPES
jgi:hypothetical protein